MFLARRARAKQYTKIGYGANEDHPDLEVRISIFFFEIFFFEIFSWNFIFQFIFLFLEMFLNFENAKDTEWFSLA